MKLRLTSIQRFSTNDGPGIRTTLFVKGCSICCPWCANPENLVYDFQEYEDENGLKKTYGIEYDIEELFEICIRDRDYYGSDGGVTVSGGEALLQADAVAELLSLLKGENVSCAIETSLYAPTKNLKKVVEYLDCIYVDLKILDINAAESILKANYASFKDNISFLYNNNLMEKVIYRIPIVMGITDTDNNIAMLKKYLSEYRPCSCEIFSVHNLGKAKYRSLGMTYSDFEIVPMDYLKRIVSMIDVDDLQININSL